MSLSLYIHWPFCESKCPYCDFNSHVRQKIDEEAFEKAYLKELERQAALIEKKPLYSIFFGGGTPSLMKAKTVESILKKAHDLFGFEENCEITLEANPSSFEVSKFIEFKQAGINRVSIGVQSFNAQDLAFLGRRHTSTQARAAIKEATRIFDRVSFDLIYARSPSQTPQKWLSELQEALSFETEHLSLYQLTLEPKTPFFQRALKGEFDLPDEDLSLELYVLTQDVLKDFGYEAYEVSNFAKPGCESRHNLCYWEYKDYIGVGAGAHGRLFIKGAKNATFQYKTPEKWLDHILSKNNGCQEQLILTQQEQAKERLLMGLRLLKGVEIASFKDMFEVIVSTERLNKLISTGDLSLENGILKTTLQGRLRLEAVLRYLVMDS